MTESARGGHVLKVFTAVVAKHAIWQQRFVRRLSGAEINIKPAIVVEVAEVGAHGQNCAIEMHSLGHIRECAVVVVTVESWRRGIVRISDFECAYIADVLYGVAGDEDVRPAIIVVVEKPRCEALVLALNASLCGYVGKPPLIGVRILSVARPVVAKKMVRAA